MFFAHVRFLATTVGTTNWCEILHVARIRGEMLAYLDTTIEMIHQDNTWRHDCWPKTPNYNGCIALSHLIFNFLFARALVKRPFDTFVSRQ